MRLAREENQPRKLPSKEIKILYMKWTEVAITRSDWEDYDLIKWTSND